MKNLFFIKSSTKRSLLMSYFEFINMRINLLVLSILISFNLKSQDVHIPNSGFESWVTTSLYNNPVGFYTSNNDALALSYVNISKSTDKYQGAFAVKIETKGTIDNIVSGNIISGKPNPMLGNDPYLGGFPYANKPDSISGYFKYNLAANDSAIVFVIFKKGAQYIKTNYDKFKIYGNQNTYKKLKFKISTLNVIPDSAIVGIMSSNPNGASNNVGNWIIADNISFVKGAVSTLIPNGDFENWTSVGRDDPSAWQNLNAYMPLNNNPYCSKSSDKHSGSFAAEISTTEMEVNGNYRPVSFITTGKFIINNLKSIQQIAKGGFKVNSNPDSLSFYYKYDNINNENDSAIVIVTFRKNLEDFGKTEVKLGPSNIYKLIKFKVYTGNAVNPPEAIADSANIILSSSDYFFPDNIGVGNKLTIDDIKFIYKPSGHKVSGTVTYDNTPNTLLTNNVKIYLINTETKKKDSTFTDAAGKYQFNNVAPGTYTLDGTSLKTYMNSGPSQGLLAMKASIGMYTIKNALRRRAGDVNFDTKVNSTDALLMSKRFVGNIKTYKIPFWLFENPSVTVSTTDMTVDFMGICAGDIGGAYTPPVN